MERSSSKNSSQRRVLSGKRPVGTGGVGGVDEDVFVQAFDQVPLLNLYSSKDLSETMSKIKDGLSSSSEDWERRCESLRSIRSVVIAGGPNFDEFLSLLRLLEIPVESCVSDLRSQVVREACITISYLAQELKIRFEHFAVFIFPTLCNLITNSAKIMSTCGIVGVRFLIKNTHSHRLIPLITQNLSSKNSILRRHGCEMLETVCREWPTNTLEKHLPALQEAIKKGMNDADQEARSLARRAYPEFSNHFPDHATALLQTLDSTKRKMIEKDLGITMGQGSGDAVPASANRPTTLRGPPPSSAKTARPALGSSSNSSTRGKDYNHTASQGRPRMGSAGQAAAVAPKKMVSQSQPEASPTSLATRLFRPGLKLLKFKTKSKKATSREVSPTRQTGIPERRSIKSRIPRSQGTSRETSPTRANNANHYAGIPVPTSGNNAFNRRSTGRSSARMRNALGQPVLNHDLESETALAHALTRGRKRFESQDSDDNGSETSSVCSDRSYRSGAYRQSEMADEISENIQEILNLLNSNQFSERKDGLLNLQKILRNRQMLNSLEIRKFTEVFSKLFNDPQSKVFGIFMDTLQSFVKEFSDMLHEWLYTLLVKLFTKQGHEIHASQQKRIGETLFVVRSNFPLEFQFRTCCKIVVESTDQTHVDVKTCLLEYMKDLLLLISPDIVDEPSPDIKMAISRIIKWTYEPKSVDVRRTSSRLILKLFDLNTTAFTSIMQSLPRTFQDAAYKVLHTYMDNADDTAPLSNASNRADIPKKRHSSGTVQGHNDTGALSMDIHGENISPEDINTFIQKTTEDIQSLSCNYDNVGVASNSSIADQRQPANTDNRPAENNGYPGHSRSHMNNSYNQPQGYQQPPMHDYNLNKDESPPDDIMADILQELSNHNERHTERRLCMENLIRMLREGSIDSWDEYFKTTLLLLLETLGDDDAEIRALALRVLQELLRAQSDKFYEYTHLTIVKILEAHKDPDKLVIRSAEECAQVYAGVLPHDLTLNVLVPIIDDYSDYQISLAALKLQMCVIKDSDPELIESLIPTMAKGLIKGCNNKESQIRKSSIFCLVEIYLKIGDKLWPSLKDLNSSKIRLLNLYITRSKENADNGGTSSSAHSNLTSPNPS